MASKNIQQLVELLLRFSKKPLKLIAVIAQATTIHQQINISTLKDSKNDFEGKQFSTPSLIIVGDVVQLHQEFKWFNADEDGSVFKKLETVKN
jgi:siroheme synthase